MKEEYSEPQLEVLGDLRGVTSLLGPYDNGDLLGGWSSSGDEDSGGSA